MTIIYAVLFLAFYIWVFWAEIKEPGRFKRAWHQLLGKTEKPPYDLWDDFDKTRNDDRNNL